MNTVMLTRVAGVLLIFVFLINVYLGLYDTNLKTLNMVHWDLNWVIAVASLVGALFLILKPMMRLLVILAGVIWPVVYVLSLGVDVYTKLCSGAPASSCWPSHTAAFDYLILNYSSIQGAAGYGWMLAPVMPIAILLLAIVFILSLISLNSTRRKTKVTPAMGPTTPKPTTPDKSSTMILKKI
ncbi:MAG: hypothetical protein ACHQ1H_13220 [Nitrososphaerales archaeon]